MTGGRRHRLLQPALTLITEGDTHLASMRLALGLLVPGPVGLHLMVYISLLWACRSCTHESCFILQI